ncbi:MAG: PIN domain-containing protein [Candidatus Diapherotrites archaeon]|nr:PIN domain-containing protein [Candidatus Diapherotrites archaeon]
MTETENKIHENYLVDTNILVYVFDEADIAKKKKAELFLAEISLDSHGYLSIQNIGEFFSVMLEKRKNIVPADFMKTWLSEYRTIFNVIHYTENTLLAAEELKQKHGIHFWDAVLAATMKEFDIHTIYTENVKDFQKIPELTVINPFK